MKKEAVSVILAFILVSINAFAAQINSTSYKQNVIVSVGGESLNGSSYKMGVAAGIINSIINSSSYINRLGFFYTWKLANNQPCTAADQCEGGFCCSNLCKSSACPEEGVSSSGGGGGAAAASAGGGGGGVAAIIEEVKDFSLSPGSITAQLALGSAKAQQIRVKNTGNAALSFNLNVLTVSDFVSLSETGFRLEPGQEKTLEANVIGRKLGSYIGQIETVGNEIKKYTDIIIEVESEQVLFDAKIDIPSAYKEVEAGGELRAQITLLNVGPPRKVDVTTTFIIKDRQGNFVYESSETFAVERQKSFVKSFKLPKDIKPGDYLAIVEVRYENSFAVSSELFRVVSKKEIIVPEALKSGKVLLYALFIFAGLVFLFVSLLVPKIKIGVGEKAKLRKCSMIIAELEEAIAKKDIAKAEKLYVKARKLYVDLKTKDKRKLYQKLVSLYKKMR